MLGEFVRAPADVSGWATQTVIQRDGALLSPEDVSKHWPEVSSASNKNCRLGPSMVVSVAGNERLPVISLMSSWC